jgi:DNA-binding response OmpR family regulator
MRVLLVDDELKFAASLQKVLQSEGYALEMAEDAQEATDRLVDGAFI